MATQEARLRVENIFSINHIADTSSGKFRNYITNTRTHCHYHYLHLQSDDHLKIQSLMSNTPTLLPTLRKTNLQDSLEYRWKFQFGPKNENRFVNFNDESLEYEKDRWASNDCDFLCRLSHMYENLKENNSLTRPNSHLKNEINLQSNSRKASKH